jgi:hypothetical protein
MKSLKNKTIKKSYSIYIPSHQFDDWELIKSYSRKIELPIYKFIVYSFLHYKNKQKRK